MPTLIPLPEIPVPTPGGPRAYETRLLGRHHRFDGLKRLLGAADLDKAGDRNAGLAAAGEVEREAARAVLASLTLGELFATPLTDESLRVDEVMRAGYDIDRELFAGMAEWTVGQAKDRLLAAPADVAARMGRGLTPVMAAAIAKLMDTHELIYAAHKIHRPTRARTTLGLPGTLSSRLQPNHPVDDPRGISMLVYVGLSLAAGDALIGVNPAVDTVESVSAVLELLDRLRRRLGVPTQICVLSHVKTQLACLDRGAPVEIMFQSLAGTERTNRTEFDVHVELLDHACRTMAQRGPLAGEAQQFMYFETGQGSEFSYGKHEGIDMTTAEALCYGLARRYDPFMVNNVTGFIGPETHRTNFEMIVANLQDHFMGKLLGLPMGMAPCYTLHADITLEGQQMATQLLTNAGANYYMDVCLNTDRMLAYFDTSAHDDQTLREISGKLPTPEYLAWALERGILARDERGVARGPRWGDAVALAGSAAELSALSRATPALYGLECAGPRAADSVARQVRANQAMAREAVHTELDLDRMSVLGEYREVCTQAKDRYAHLNAPALGGLLSEEARSALAREGCEVQVVITDGLSARAVHENLPQLWPVLADALAAGGWRCGRPLVARHGRVKLAEPIAEAIGCDLVVLLIGERPGGDALSATSLSAYLVLHLRDEAARRDAATFARHPSIRFEYTVISNIYGGGLPPVEAGAVVARKVGEILTHRAAGNRLEARLAGN
jgi:ethanolamine ammonia-lyase large subunit